MKNNEPVLKEYSHWILILSAKQHPYIGRCKAWCKREEAEEITEMTKEERDELFAVVLPEWESAVEKLYTPYRTNFAIFGNTVPHLHAHLIPRYNEVKNFYNIEFKDPNPTGNYSPYQQKDIDTQTLNKIAEEIRLLL